MLRHLLLRRNALRPPHRTDRRRQGAWSRWNSRRSSTAASITGVGAGSWCPAAARSSAAAIATTTPRTRSTSRHEINKDFTGVPAVVDLACMRDVVSKLGSDPNKINPLVPSGCKMKA